MIVLQGFPPNRTTTNPYLVMLAETLRAQPDVEVQNFTWKTALTGTFDVYHVHWPENLGSGSSPLKSLARQLLTLAFLARLKAKRIPIVRTVHNLERPSGLGRLQHRILDIFDNQTAVRIRLNRHTPCPPGSAVRLIPHGHYIDWFGRFPEPQTVPGRIAFTGLVRRYKGVESLITAFRALRGPGLSLHVAGNPSSESISGEIRRLCGDDQRIHLSLAFQSEEDFAREIREAQLVVLPYKLMHNSGGTLAALSLQRPVLIPDNEINRELAREVGPGWVHLFSGELTAGDLQRAVDAVEQNPPAQAPDLSSRGWEHTGRAHVRAYEQALHRIGASIPGVPA